MIRPSFDEAIAALTVTDARFPWVHPTTDEAEVAAVLAEIAQLHQAGNDEPDHRGRYGRCTCQASWPCEAWRYGEELALQWLGRGAARYIAHARTVLDNPRSAA